MAIPTTTASTRLVPDADGYVWEADWSSPAAVQGQWDPGPANASGVIYPIAQPWDVRADDGVMGSRYLHHIPETGWGIITSATAFDHTKPLTVRQRVRLVSRENFGENFGGLAVLYNGEREYDGPTIWQGNLGHYFLGPPDPEVLNPPRWTDEARAMGPPGVVGAYVPLDGTVMDVETVWNPSTLTLSGRVSLDGGVTWGAWTVHSCPAPYTHQSINAIFSDPVHIWSGVTQSSQTQPYYGRVVLDHGRMRIAGTPMAACADWVGWRRGAFVNAAFFASPDTATLTPIAGLTGALADNAQYIVKDSASPSVTRDWSWTSERIGVNGGRYRSLRWRAVNAVGTGKLRIYVRDAATGALIADAIIPNNSTGLVDATPVEAATTLEPAGVQRVSLAAVPVGITIYLDVQGHTDASDGGYLGQARLGGWWLDFGDRLAATFVPTPGDPTSGTVRGRRASGATVTGSSPTATVGSTTYPTTTNPAEAGTSWEAEVTGLAPGITTVLTITDGTDSILLDLTDPSAALDSTSSADSNTVQVISPAFATSSDSTAQGDSASCLLTVTASVATPFLLAASILVAVLYDTASADTGAFADAVSIARSASQADGTAGTDAVTIALGCPASDATAGADGVGATLGAYASASDASSGSDSALGALRIVSAASDSTASSSSTVCELISPAAVGVTDSASSADSTAIVAALGTADATGSSDSAFGYVGMLTGAGDSTTSADLALVSGSVRSVVPRITLYERSPQSLIYDRSPGFAASDRSPRVVAYERSDD